MKLYKLKLALLLVSFGFMVSCSGDDIDSDDDSDIVEEMIEEEVVVEEQMDNSDLTERYIFNGNMVIENSYNTGGCDSPPCDTIDESLVNVFLDQIPDDPYFYLSTDRKELNLECQLEKGRRTEFKQRSEGPLTSLSKIEMEGIYYDIPDNGVTIAQVHNRGGNSNKPFFRLVLYKDGLETVIRKDPEVSSSDTSFSKEDFTFVNGEDYDLSSLEITLEKSEGAVHIEVIQNGVNILDKSYVPDTTTDWVNDTGIANGFYLKAGLYNDDGPHTENLIVGYTKFLFETND